ncbi:hypothetical protein M1437_04310 [Patescibacteria group bacterium]|nr:hypothetical protein [Patescibacteria group bacterium]
MKKVLPIFALALLLLTTPAIASKDKANQQSNGCDPDDNWKNHGAYVSCVAKLHEGGKNVSEAAKSDIGKKEDQDEEENEDDEDGQTASPSPSASPAPSVSPSPSSTPIPSGSPSPSPSSSPTPLPSQSPTASPSSTPSPSPSASPSASPTAAITESVNLELRALVEVLKNILASLQKLI